MNNQLIVNAQISLPSDSFLVVSELIKKLGGVVFENKDNEEYITIPSIDKDKRVGKMLKGLRLRANMTQKDLATAISVPQSHISEYEANKRTIPKEKVAMLAKILNSVETHFIS